MSVVLEQDSLLILTPGVNSGQVVIEQNALLLLTSTTVLLTQVSGTFQDLGGNPIANGTITFRLTLDGTTTTNQVNAGKLVSIQLNSSGSIPAGIFIWPNSTINPVSSYLVQVYTSSGQFVWASYFQISGSSFNIGSITPNL